MKFCKLWSLLLMSSISTLASTSPASLTTFSTATSTALATFFTLGGLFSESLSASLPLALPDPRPSLLPPLLPLRGLEVSLPSPPLALDRLLPPGLGVILFARALALSSSFLFLSLWYAVGSNLPPDPEYPAPLVGVLDRELALELALDDALELALEEALEDARDVSVGPSKRPLRPLGVTLRDDDLEASLLLGTLPPLLPPRLPDPAIFELTFLFICLARPAFSVFSLETVAWRPLISDLIFPSLEVADCFVR